MFLTGFEVTCIRVSIGVLEERISLKQVILERAAILVSVGKFQHTFVLLIVFKLSFELRPIGIFEDAYTVHLVVEPFAHI